VQSSKGRFLWVLMLAMSLTATTLAQSPRASSDGRIIPPLPPDRTTSRSAPREIPAALRIEPPPADDAPQLRPPSRTPGEKRAEVLPDKLRATPLPQRPAETRSSEKHNELAANPTPSVTVEVITPTNAAVGQPATFEIVVRNAGSRSVDRVTVIHDLPENLQFIGTSPEAQENDKRLSWKIAKLEAGEEKRIKVKVKANDDGEFDLRASASITVSGASTARFIKPKLPKLAVKMTGPDTVLMGEEVAFEIQITNTGPVRVKRIVLRDKLPSGLTHPQGREIEAEIGGLKPGESRTLTLRTIAAKSGTFANEIHATAQIDEKQADEIDLAGGIANTSIEATATATVHVGEPALSVKQAGPKQCQQRAEAIFSIEVNNSGSARTKNVRVVDQLPRNMEFIAASDDGRYDATSHAIVWSLGALDFGTQRMLTVKARGRSVGEGVNRIHAEAEGDLNAQSDLPVRVEGAPSLSLEILPLNDPAPIRKDVEYEIRVFNEGSQPCTNLHVGITLPDGMFLRDAQAPSPYKLDENQVVFAPYSKLGTRADLVYRIKVQCKTPGDAKLRVQLTCDQLQRPVIREEKSRFLQP